jgi:hypothetical protein
MTNLAGSQSQCRHPSLAGGPSAPTFTSLHVLVPQHGSTAREASGSLAATAQPRPISQTSQMIFGNTVAANGPWLAARLESLMEPTEPPELPPRRSFPVHGCGAQPGQTIRAVYGYLAARATATGPCPMEQCSDTSTICGCTSHSQDAPSQNARR